MSNLEKVVSYRNHAEALRTMAGRLDDEEYKRTLMKIADDYERMAAETEATMRSDRSRLRADCAAGSCCIPVEATLVCRFH